jgi:hypothetical protein
MSLNFDVNSNLSLVRRFHTGKIVKMCQFYSDSFRFFLQPTVIVSVEEDLRFQLIRLEIFLGVLWVVKR